MEVKYIRAASKMVNEEQEPDEHERSLDNSEKTGSEERSTLPSQAQRCEDCQDNSDVSLAARIHQGRDDSHSLVGE